MLCQRQAFPNLCSFPADVPGEYGLDYGEPLEYELAAKLTGTTRSFPEVYRLLEAMKKANPHGRPGLAARSEFICGPDVAAVFIDMAENWKSTGPERAAFHPPGQWRKSRRRKHNQLYGRDLSLANFGRMGAQARPENADGNRNRCSGHNLVLRN